MKESPHRTRCAISIAPPRVSTTLIAAASLLLHQSRTDATASFALVTSWVPRCDESARRHGPSIAPNIAYLHPFHRPPAAARISPQLMEEAASRTRRACAHPADRAPPISTHRPCPNKSAPSPVSSAPLAPRFPRCEGAPAFAVRRRDSHSRPPSAGPRLASDWDASYLEIATIVAT